MYKQKSSNDLFTVVLICLQLCVPPIVSWPVGHQLTAVSPLDRGNCLKAQTHPSITDRQLFAQLNLRSNQLCIWKREQILLLLRYNDRLADSFNESALRRSFCERSKSVIFQLFWRIDEKPSCLQSQWLMKPALGQREEEEEEVRSRLGKSKNTLLPKKLAQQ